MRRRICEDLGALYVFPTYECIPETIHCDVYKYTPGFKSISARVVLQDMQERVVFMFEKQQEIFIHNERVKTANDEKI